MGLNELRSDFNVSFADLKMTRESKHAKLIYYHLPRVEQRSISLFMEWIRNAVKHAAADVPVAFDLKGIISIITVSLTIKRSRKRGCGITDQTCAIDSPLRKEDVNRDETC